MKWGASHKPWYDTGYSIIEFWKLIPITQMISVDSWEHITSRSLHKLYKACFNGLTLPIFSSPHHKQLGLSKLVNDQIRLQSWLKPQLVSIFFLVFASSGSKAFPVFLGVRRPTFYSPSGSTNPLISIDYELVLLDMIPEAGSTWHGNANELIAGYAVGITLLALHSGC